MNIRPFSDSDYPAWTAVYNAVFADRPVSEDDMRHSDSQRNPDPKYAHHKLVAEVDTQVVATLWYGHWEEMYHPQTLVFTLNVHPAWRGRGIGGALYQEVLTGIAPHNPRKLKTFSYENQLEGIRFLTQRGFEETMRFWESELDMSTFDPAPYEGVEEGLERHGLFIHSERELMTDPEHERKLYDMNLDILRDLPVPEPITPQPFERWRETRRNNKHLDVDAYFIVLDKASGVYAGTTALFKFPPRPYLNTGLTGVRRDYRRRGVALALKLRAIHHAKAKGERAIRTDNASTNQAMLAINNQLGFKRDLAEIDFLKRL